MGGDLVLVTEGAVFFVPEVHFAEFELKIGHRILVFLVVFSGMVQFFTNVGIRAPVSLVQNFRKKFVVLLLFVNRRARILEVCS